MQVRPKHFGKGAQFAAEFITGILFVVALLVLIYFTAIVRGKDWFFGVEGQSTYTVRFSDVGTLSQNDKVRVMGLETGKVQSLKLGDNNNEVFVVISLKKKIPIYSNYVIAVQNASVFGGGYVYINPGTPDKPEVSKDMILKGQAPIDILNEASSLIASFREDEKKVREVLLEGNFLANISDAAKSIKQSSGEFNTFMLDLKEGKGTLGKLLKDPAVYDDAKEAFSSVSKASDRMITLMADVQGGKGTLGKIMTSDEAYKILVEALKDFKEVSGKLASGDGTAGRLLNDNGKLYDSLNSSLLAAQDVATQLKDGKGTLGLMIKDPSLYFEVKETVRQFRAAIEDYREQAPIATFGSMVLGAL